MRRGAVLLCIALAACGDDPAPPSPAPPPPARTVAPTRRTTPETEPAPRLRADVGGWTPSDELLDRAERLGERLKEAEAAAAEKDEPPEKPPVEVLRAGLRLADDAKARLCAARLTWKQIDGWECARCVELLSAGVLREEDGASFEELRSYLGSVDLAAFIRAFPPPPWEYPASGAVSHLHRLIRSRDAAVWMELVKRPEEEVSETAWKEMQSALNYDDALLPVLTEHEMADDAGRTPTGPGLPALYRRRFRDALDQGIAFQGDWFDRRALWRATPSAADAELLCEVAEKDDFRDDPLVAGGIATLLLGKLSDERGLALLRKRVADTAPDEQEDVAALMALARRGDESAVAFVESMSDERATWLACLMETAPARARKLLEDRLLGEDDERAEKTLRLMSEFTPPGAGSAALGFDWRRTSFDGFEAAALAKPHSATRLAWIGAVVPGCRKRRVAEAAARALVDADVGTWHDYKLAVAATAFLESGAPETLRASLRRLAQDDSPSRDPAEELLLEMGDAASGARLAARHPNDARLARSPCPETKKALEDRVRRDAVTGSPTANDLGAAMAALAVLHGLPEEATEFRLEEPPLAAIDALLAGRPRDWLGAILEAYADTDLGNVGAVDDLRVRAYLHRLREKRELGHYWYATGQLAVLGDPACRAEFQQTMHDGRYRIVDEAGAFARTLGWNLAATMPFWLEELRTNCCRAVTVDIGDLLSNGFDEITVFNAGERTGYERAKELWDAAGGRFVRSRVLDGRFVPVPR